MRYADLFGSIVGGRAHALTPHEVTVDHVNWNSEAGRVSSTIARVQTRDFQVHGYTHHASAKAPQYEIKSGKTEHIAFRTGSALAKFRD